MNTDVIRADYDELETIAVRFGKSSQVVTQMQSRVHQAFSQLQDGGWIGQGADSFFREMDDRVLPAVQRLHEALTEAQRITALIKHLLQEADEEAANPFRGTDATVPGGFRGGLTGGLLDDIGQNFGIGIGASLGAAIGGGVWGPDGFNPALGASINDLVGRGFGGDVPSPVFFQNGGLAPGGAEYGIPQDWLSGVVDSLQEYIGASYNDYGIPHDWLSGVTEGLGGVNDWGIPPDWLSGVEDGLMNGGGNGSGVGGGGAAGSAGAPPAETTPLEEPEIGGSGSGGASSPPSDIHSPYGNARDFRMGSGTSAPVPVTADGGKFLYQSLGGLSGGGATGDIGATPVTIARPPIGEAAAAAAVVAGSSGQIGVPFGIAAASPFIALLGKAVQSQFKDKEQ